MSVVKSNAHQVGQSVTATNNMTWYQPATPDGTVRLGVGNAGATTADVITASSTGIAVPSMSSANTFGFKNRLIDAGFIINQRGYTSGTALSSGSYAHDRWKAGSSGCTYTFTQGSNGVPITITITAGALQQVIEGCNVAEGGTYTLSWQGTAQASINGGAASASPLTVTGVTAGANMTIQFNTGTVYEPQLEVGSATTSFDFRAYGTELALCQRYFEIVADTSNYANSFMIARMDGAASALGVFQFRVNKRASASITISGSATLYFNSTSQVVTSYGSSAGSGGGRLQFMALSGGAINTAAHADIGSLSLTASAEL